jgi:hypothetical protein
MGAAASTLPMQIDKETFRRLSGGNMNDALFDANAINGVISRDKLMELAHMRDCLLSHEFGPDVYGRDNHQRVMKINEALKAKGLITWMDDQKPQRDVVNHVTMAVNRSSALVCFFTRNYFEKVVGNFPNDHVNVEFGYTLSKKHPSFMIPVVMEEHIWNPVTWPGNIGKALSAIPAINFIDDNNFDMKIEELYQRIIKISRTSEGLHASQSLTHSSMLSQTNKSKEEQQFFQWLARSTNIDENRRIIYCTSFVKAGITNVFTLAKVMNSNSTFLPSLGINERDADQIALAIRDLGLGYAPVRDFEQSQTIETVVYALQKSSAALEDPILAESALSCVARVAASNPIMPSIMNDAGICEAVLKLMTKHLPHGGAMEQGCLAIYNMSANNPEIVERFGSLTACDVVPRTLKCHIENLNVVNNACLAISILATFKDNRKKLSFTGANDVVIKSIPKSMRNPDVLVTCYLAANRLAFQYMDNVGKLALAGGCEACVITLQTHPHHSPLMEQVFQLITVLAVEPGSRVIFGGQETSCVAIVGAMNTQMESPQVLLHACVAINAVIMGNAFNRSCLGRAGACEIVKQLLLKYANILDVLQAASKAVFALASGNLEQKHRFNGIQPLFQAVLSSPQVPDEVKADVKEALLKVQ